MFMQVSINSFSAYRKVPVKLQHCLPYLEDLIPDNHKPHMLNLEARQISLCSAPENTAQP